MIETVNFKPSETISKALIAFDLNNHAGLLFTNELKNKDSQILPIEWFELEKADNLGAIAVYFRKTENETSTPHIYVFDLTINTKSDALLGEIHTKIWSAGTVQLVYVIKSTSIDIFDTTKPANRDKNNQLSPCYLEENLGFLSEIDQKFKKYKSDLFDTGVYWEKNNKISDSSALSILIDFLNVAYEKLKNNLSSKVAQKLIVQSILIKYLEEREDLNGNKVCPTDFFKEFNNSNNLCDVLKSGQYYNLCQKLNNENSFNGNVFGWSDANEIKELQNANLSILADLLDGDINLKNKQKYIWRQFSFTYLPIELFNRLYEQFLGFDNKNTEFTPPHLAKFLVDECMPINTTENLPNPLNYKILDPSCGSGVFLVIAFKRLIQWYRIKNNYSQEIEIEVLKNILRNNIYGVELKSDAANLAIFSLSLALCDFCNPSKLWTELHFDNIRGRNIYEADFFDWIKTNTNEFDLVIGNPPFNENKKDDEKIEKKSIKGEPKIALRFLRDSMKVLKDGGLQCLILPAGEFLHNETSKKFRNEYFTKNQVVQIIDFTCLARNKVLWNMADVACVSVFAYKQLPNRDLNILHAVIKKSHVANRKLYFELDEYDLQYVTQQEAFENPYIWKINLLGGGRIKQLVSKVNNISKFKKTMLQSENYKGIICEEGRVRNKSISSKYFTNDGIDLINIPESYFSSFDRTEPKTSFSPPTLIIKKDLSLDKLVISIPVTISNHYFPFNNNCMGIHLDDINKLINLKSFFSKNAKIIAFNLCTTSSRLLVSKNTSFLTKDILNSPFSLDEIRFNNYENSIIDDVIVYNQDSIRTGINSKSQKKIKQSFLISFADSFSSVLNSIYEKDGKRFILSEAQISSNYVKVVIRYSDLQDITPIIETINEDISITDLLKGINTETLQIKRIIRIYRENEIIFIKPNQIKYWLNTIAFRDADKTFSDIVNHRFFNAG